MGRRHDEVCIWAFPSVSPVTLQRMLPMTNVINSGSSRSGGAPSQLTATFMSKLLESGDLQRHIFQTLQPTYARRYRIMIDAIVKHLIPLGVTIPQPNCKMIGGYFIWITLPTPLHAEGVAVFAKLDENLVIAPGLYFSEFPPHVWWYFLSRKTCFGNLCPVATFQTCLTTQIPSLKQQC